MKTLCSSVLQYPVKMIRVAILSIVLTVVLADSDIMKKCHRLGHPGTMRCCKTELLIPKIEMADLKDCMDIAHKPHSCEQEICIATKRGYASDNGTLDKAAFEKKFAQDFGTIPDVVKAIKENCINGNLDAFGEPNDCELIKMKNCMHMQAINECKEWNDDGPCAGFKDLVKECAKVFS